MPTYEYARPALTVDCVVFGVDEEDLRVLLIQRGLPPFEGKWALPGGFVRIDEPLEDAARRELEEETGLSRVFLEQLYTFGAPDRSPDERVVSVVYWALVHSDEVQRAVADENVYWFDEDQLPALAFDHREIIDYALWRLRTKLQYSRIAHALLGETFTMAELRGVHEAVLRRRLDPANFRRTMEASGTLIDTGQRLAGTPHRPPALYRFDTGAGPAASDRPATTALQRTNP